MSFAAKHLQFIKNLQYLQNLPEDVEILKPWLQREVWELEEIWLSAWGRVKIMLF